MRRGTCSTLIRKPEREKQFRRTGLGWEDIFGMDVEGLKCARDTDVSASVQAPAVTS
jgi:hypothetical protein